MPCRFPPRFRRCRPASARAVRNAVRYRAAERRGRRAAKRGKARSVVPERTSAVPLSVIVTRPYTAGIPAVSRAPVCSRACGDAVTVRVTPRHPKTGYSVAVAPQECAGACAGCGMDVPPRRLDSAELTPETLIAEDSAF
ncbi:hypothetical protein GCM10023224_40800 [Streptomonospora halophila]|uniref:Uncharacterized protein n=1 Tax=Streptomonospora halophila TaxID=427369 RepID=A0ABP9GT14_9ACTN